MKQYFVTTGRSILFLVLSVFALLESPHSRADDLKEGIFSSKGEDVLPVRHFLPTGALLDLPDVGTLWQMGRSSPAMIFYEGSTESPTVDVALIVGIPLYLFNLQEKIHALVGLRGGGLFRLWLTPQGSAFNFGYFDGIFGAETALSSPSLKRLTGNFFSPYTHLGVTHTSSHLGDAVDERRISDSREKVWIQQDGVFLFPFVTATLFAGLGHYFNTTRLPLEEERWIGTEFLAFRWAKVSPFFGYSLFNQRINHTYPISESPRVMSRIQTPTLVTHTLLGGIRLRKKLDVFLQYYEGNSPFGQLYGVHDSFLGVGVRYDPFR